MKASKTIVMLVLMGSLFCASSMATTQQHETNWFNSGYGHIGAILSPQGWGSFSFDVLDRDYDLTSKFAGGVHLSGYWVVNKNFHLGLYFNYLKGKCTIENTSSGDVDHFGLGVSLKAGGKVSNRVWLGLVGNIGYYALAVDSLNDTYDGFEISPQIHMDVLPASVGIAGLKMGFFAAFGPAFIPFIGGSIGAYDFEAWLITLQLRFGLTFGR